MELRKFLLVCALGLAATHCGAEAEDPGALGDDQDVTGAAAGDDEEDGAGAAQKNQDNVPGSLVITSPERAAFIKQTSAPLEIKGTGATPALTINGEPANVAPDGSFTATLRPEPGLNLILASDGDARLEQAFLYGKFESLTTPVPQGVAVSMNAAGVGAKSPSTSLTTVINEALRGRDLIAGVRGQSMSGSSGPFNWSYRVTNARYASVAVSLGARSGGVNATAVVNDVSVTGTITVKAPLGISYSRSVTLRAGKTTLAGPVALAVDKASGGMKVSMSNPSTKLEGFRFDSNNAGLPCCVDSLMTNFLRPRVEKALRDGVRQHLPKALEVSLEGLGLPKTLDLSKAGVPKPVPIKTRFDGGEFQSNGMSISASVLFGGAFAKDEPGAAAPGWLRLGKTFTPKRTRPIGASFAVDAVNQLFLTAWGTGAFERAPVDAAPLAAIKVDAGLPPILDVTDDGAVSVTLAEIGIEAMAAGERIRTAITVGQAVTPSAQGQTLVFTPKGEPTIAITWLEAPEVIDPAIRDAIAPVAKGLVTAFLKPVKLPFPRFSLNAAGGGLAGKSLVITTPKVAVDPAAARLGVEGGLRLER